MQWEYSQAGSCEKRDMIRIHACSLEEAMEALHQRPVHSLGHAWGENYINAQKLRIAPEPWGHGIGHLLSLNFRRSCRVMP